MTGKVKSDLFILCQVHVEKDDDGDQEEAVCPLEIAGHVIDLQEANVENCRYRSECNQEQPDHRRDVSNPFQCFHSFRIYNSTLDSYLSETSCFLLCNLSQDFHDSSFKSVQCELRLVPGSACCTHSLPQIGIFY